jgi:hypothetical protein
MIDLSGKKILFIGPKYYSYHTQIIEKCERFGAVIDFYPEMVNNLINRFAKIASAPLKKYLRQRYLNTILSAVKSKHYDIFFLIRGEIVTSEFLKQLKAMSDKTLFVMYQWDSIAHNNYTMNINHFDRVLTFDKTDAQHYKIDYLPLFYTDQYKNLSTIQSANLYDIVFFGAYHSDRLQIIKQIDKEAKLYNLKFYHHLYITKFSLFRGLVTGKIGVDDLKFLKTFTVPSAVIIDAYAKTKTVLDIEMIHQNGLTIRTLEVLGSNLKLITTNANIADEPFYNSKRIFLLDRNNIKLDPSFFENDLAWDTDIERYHIDNWLQKIFSKEAV